MLNDEVELSDEDFDLDVPREESQLKESELIELVENNKELEIELEHIVDQV